MGSSSRESESPGGLVKIQVAGPPTLSEVEAKKLHFFPVTSSLGDTDAAGLETTFEPLSSGRDLGIPRCAACVENHCSGPDLTKGGKEEADLRVLCSSLLYRIKMRAC